MTQRIAIIGAGVMGRVLAWQLLQDSRQAEREVELTLFDKDPMDEGQAAAYTAAGMLTPYCEVETAETLVFDMGKHSLTLWPAMVDSLGTDVDFHHRGSLVVAHRNDHADYARFNHQLRSKLNDHAQQEYVSLTQLELRKVQPSLAEHFSEALYLPDEAWVDSGLFMQAMAKYLIDHKVKWYAESDIREFGKTESGAFVIDGEKIYSYDQVIDCRGLAAKDALQDLRGVRGEVLTLHAPDVDIDKLVRLMHPRYRLYLVPRRDHTYLLGATQIESEDNGPITVRSALELLSAVYSLHAGFAEARVIKTDTNCRPALRDNLPRIDDEGALMRINGLYRHGYLLSPVVAQEASNKILGLERSTLFANIIND